MCGRYYVDDDTSREIERIIRIAEEKVKKFLPCEADSQPGQSSEHGASMPLQARDIHPTETAPVLIADKQSLCCQNLKWGLPCLLEEKEILSWIFNGLNPFSLSGNKFYLLIFEHMFVIISAQEAVT